MQSLKNLIPKSDKLDRPRPREFRDCGAMNEEFHFYLSCLIFLLLEKLRDEVAPRIPLKHGTDSGIVEHLQCAALQLS